MAFRTSCQLCANAFVFILAFAIVLTPPSAAQQSKGPASDTFRASPITPQLPSLSAPVSATEVGGNDDPSDDPGQHPRWRMQGLPLIAPLFIEDGQFSSTLVLISGTTVSTYADLIVHSMEGKKIASQRVQFGPHEQKRINIGALLKSAGSAATTGNVTILQSPDLDGPAIYARRGSRHD